MLVYLFITMMVMQFFFLTFFTCIGFHLQAVYLQVFFFFFLTAKRLITKPQDSPFFREGFSKAADKVVGELDKASSHRVDLRLFLWIFIIRLCSNSSVFSETGECANLVFIEISPPAYLWHAGILITRGFENTKYCQNSV